MTISYKGFSVTQRFIVMDDRTEEINDFWAPNAIHVDVGTALDLSGECTVFYSTGRQVKMTLQEVLEAGGTMTGTYDINTVGDYPVKFFYPGFDGSDHFTWIYVEGEVPVTVKGIRLDASQAKTAYNVGEDLDISNMKLYLVYSDNNESDITDDLRENLFSDFDTTSTGERTATVTYVSEYGSFATRFDYRVSE